MKIKNLVYLFTVLTFLSCFISCNQVEKEDSKPVLVTTIYPMYDILKNIAGPDYRVEYIIKPGQDPHTFEPTPETIINIEQAEIIFIVGFGFEFWLNKVIKSKTAPIVELSKGIQPITHYHFGEGDSSEENKHHHHHGFYDPHYWLSPKNAVIIAGTILNALQREFPGDKENFKSNYEDYTKKLNDLDNYISDSFSQCKTRDYIAYHPAWLYLSRDYNLQMAGVVMKKPGQEPAPADLAELVDVIEDKNIKVIFAERRAPKNIPNILKEETGIKILELDPLGGTGDLDSYLKLIKYNVNLIKEGLCGE